MVEPLLDILIPAYEHPEGVRRILNSLIRAPQEVRVVVYDDSITNLVEDCLKEHVLAHRVIYRRNQPSMGAIPNWNALLMDSKAPYAMVLHHDECPLTDDFFEVLVKNIKSGPDLILLDLWVHGFWPGTLRMHTPRRLRSWIAHRFPAYLLRRNVLGPPSVVVLKESLRAAFDPRIPWMVDVEWYFRILRTHGLKIQFMDAGALVHTGYHQSISQSMKGTPAQRRCRESKILIESGYKSFVLQLNSSTGTVYRILARLESAVWVAIRFYHRIGLGMFRFRILPSHLKNKGI